MLLSGNPYLVFDLPADLLQRLLLGFGERQFGWDWVTFCDQRPTLLLSQHQRAGPLQLLHTKTKEESNRHDPEKVCYQRGKKMDHHLREGR